MKKLSIKILLKRLAAKTPSFFKRVSAIGLTIATSATATKAYLVMNDVTIEWLNRYVEYGIIAGAISTFIAKMAVENPEELHNDSK